MDFLDFFKAKDAPPNSIDELIYEFIAFEISSGNLRPGVWTKALSDSEWNEPKAKSYYVKMRFEQVKGELAELLHVVSPENLKLLEEARHAGLTEDEIKYLDPPIKAVRYLEKYKKTKDQLAHACALKKIKSVMSHGVLWVSDRPFK